MALVSSEVVPGTSVAVLTIASGPINALSSHVFAELADAIQRTEQDPHIQAIVLCGAGTTFSAGADIAEFPALTKAIKSGRMIDLNATPDLIEHSKKLVVAAIHGTALGGGLEVALSCHYRVALKSAKFGLPEVQLGLCPGAGGTQRLPRLIGIPDALQMITTGKIVSAPVALRQGLIDAIVPGTTRDDILQAAINIASTSNMEISARCISQWPCVPIVPQAVFDGARRMAARAGRGLVAPQACIDAVEAAVTATTWHEGLRQEGKIFRALLLGTQARALQYVFFAQRQACVVPGVDLRKAMPLKSVGIVGAGTMGGGIAMCFVQVGIPVVLIEMKQEYLDHGLNVIRSNYKSVLQKKMLNPQQMEQYMSLIIPSLDYAALADVDLAIEAVFEDMGIKKAVLSKLDVYCKDSCILCTNTSTLSIDEIAQATGRPQSVVGAHFFSPANKMKLLENVRGKASSERAIATVMHMGKRIKKVPVLVGNGFGFVGNRMIEPYGRESAYLVEEGCSVSQVDTVLYKFGMPIGPFTMSDLAGNDIGMKIRKSLGLLDEKTRPKDERYHGVLGDRLCNMGRLGMKVRKGWYDYDDSRKAAPSHEVASLIEHRRREIAQKPRVISDDEILERTLYPLMNTGFSCLEEGIALRPSDIDIVYVFGYGFPAHRGGPMYYADAIGCDVLLAGLRKYGAIHSNISHWKPSALLERIVKEQTTLERFWANQPINKGEIQCKM